METIEVTFKSGQRGKKACGGCGKLVGVRLAKCECGFDFKSKVESPVSVVKKVDAPTPPERYHYNTETLGVFRKSDTRKCIYGTLLTPSGVCPVQLKDFSIPGIEDWAIKVLNIMMGEGGYKGIAVSALEYWAKNYYQSQNKELAKLIKDTLTELTKTLEF